MPGNGAHRATRLRRGHARQRGDHDRAGLGLPPGVDDRAAVATDDLAVPHPRLGIDRLTDRSENPQAGQVVGGREFLAPLHEGADRGRRGVEDRHAVALDELPPAVLARRVGRALVEHRRRAVGQRAVDDVAVAGDPADVGAAPVDVGFGMQVEDHPVGRRHLRQIAAGGVQDPLGLAGRPRRVEQEQRLLGCRRPAAYGLSAAARRGRATRCRDRRSIRRPARYGERRGRVRRPAQLSSASSTAGLSDAGAPRRYPPSAVMTSLAFASRIRSVSACAEKPPNTTLWAAPTRAQASIATTASGIIGR